eukprot:TCONS_00007732-protein
MNDELGIQLKDTPLLEEEDKKAHDNLTMLLTKLCRRVSDLELALDRKEIEMYKLRNYCSKKCDHFERTIAELSKILPRTCSHDSIHHKKQFRKNFGKRLSETDDFLRNNNSNNNNCDFENLESHQQQRKRRQINENTFEKSSSNTPNDSLHDPPMATSEPISPLDTNILHLRTDRQKETSKLHRPFIGSITQRTSELAHDQKSTNEERNKTSSSIEQLPRHISIYDTSQDDIDDQSKDIDDDLNVSQTDSDMQVEVASVCVISSSDESRDDDGNLLQSHQKGSRSRKWSISSEAGSKQISDDINSVSQFLSTEDFNFDHRRTIIGEMPIPEEEINNNQIDSPFARDGKITLKEYQRRRQNHLAMTEKPLTLEHTNMNQNDQEISRLSPEISNISQIKLGEKTKVTESFIQDNIDDQPSSQNENIRNPGTSFGQQSDDESLKSNKSSFKESSSSEDEDSSSSSSSGESSSSDESSSEGLSEHDETSSQIESQDCENVDFDLIESKFEVLTPVCSVYRWNISEFSSKLFRSDLKVFSKPFKVRDIDNSNTFELKMTWFSELNDGLSIELLENGINPRIEMNVILTCEGNGYFNSQTLIANSKLDKAFLHINHVNVATSEFCNSKSVMDFIENDTLFINCYFEFC